MRIQFQTMIMAMGLVIVGCGSIPKPAADGPLSGLTITVDAGHGHTQAYDAFRVGPGGEREEWINLRVAKHLQKLLLQNGAKVVMTRTKDEDVNLGGRASIAIRNKSDFFVSVHHNGSVNDSTLDYPLVYIWGDAEKNPASVDLGKTILTEVNRKMKFQSSGGSGIYSDFLIYPEGTSVLRNTYPVIPGIIGEMGFFTNAAGEARMKNSHFEKLEAEAYLQGILDYAGKGIPRAIPLKPVGDDYLRPESADIIFQLKDGLGGYAFDPNSLVVTVEGDTVLHEWDTQTGHLMASPPRCTHETVKVQVFGRNLNGNALHPREWDFLTMIGQANRWRGPWYIAFKRADSLRMVLNPADQYFAQQLDSTIVWYQRALKLQPVNPRAAETEYRLGQMYSMSMEWLKDDTAKAHALQYFERVINYYPTSEFVQPAREEKRILEEVF